MDALNQLIDRIYTAATDAAVWPEVMKSLQSEFRCTSVGLYCADMRSGDVSVVELRDIDPGYVRDYVDYYLKDNPWCAVPELQIPGRIRTDRSLDEHYRKPGYYKSTEFYNEWMRPQGFIHSMSTNLLSDGDLRTKFYMYRNRRPGSFTPDDIRRFEHLSGHLMRAVGIAYRLNTRESGVAGGLSVLDHLRFGVILLDSGLRIVHANRFAETLLQSNDGLHLRDSMVRALHADDSRELERSLRTALSAHLGWSTQLPEAASVRRVAGRRALRVTAVPLPRHAENLFLVRCAAVALMISDPELEAVVPDQWLRHRYGLTGAEARLARSLVRGESLRAAAESNGLTYETARWYLKNIFQKTGTGGQPQLVRTLLSEQVLEAGTLAPRGEAAVSDSGDAQLSRTRAGTGMADRRLC
jgi:DNA-binding CsgD family transcriptional regulator